MIATIPNNLSLTTQTTISAAHWIPTAHGRERIMHGHNFRFLVTVGGEKTGSDWLNINDLRAAVQSAIGSLDHMILTPWTEEELDALHKEHSEAWRLLGAGSIEYCLFPLGADPTAENLARYAAEQLATIPVIDKYAKMVDVMCMEVDDYSGRVTLVRDIIAGWVSIA